MQQACRHLPYLLCSLLLSWWWWDALISIYNSARTNAVAAVFTVGIPLVMYHIYQRAHYRIVAAAVSFCLCSLSLSLSLSLYSPLPSPSLLARVLALTTEQQQHHQRHQRYYYCHPSSSIPVLIFFQRQTTNKTNHR